MRFVRPVVRTVGSLTVVIRDMNRMRQVGIILAKHGLGMLISSNRKNSEELQTTPQRAVAAIQELGPTFIKFGQILSTRPDILPDNYLKEFQNLQDNIEPLEFGIIKQVLEAEIGEHWEDSFDSIEEKSLASASIAQVHKAVLKGGRQVVLKIQRPMVEHKIRSDLSILRFILERALEEYPEFELFDPRGMFKEFKKSIFSELDFDKEAKNLQRFRKNFQSVPEVHWPAPITYLSTKKVLCMEFLDGIKIRNARNQ